MAKGKSDLMGSSKAAAYIAKCPKDVQGKLRRIRAAIRKVAPDATEITDIFKYLDTPMKVMITMECLSGSALKEPVLYPTLTSPSNTRL